MKNRMKEKGKKFGVRMGYFMMQLVTMLMIAYPVYAANQTAAATGEPTIVTGTKNLVAAGIALLTALVTGMGTFNAIKVGTKWINASPEERPKHQKELVLVIIATVVTLTIGSTLTYIVGFYN